MGSVRKIATNVLLAFLLIPQFFKAQDLLITQSNLGFNGGLTLAFGTHFQRLGINLNFFFIQDFFQANTEIRAYYSFKNLGPTSKNPELVITQGVLFGYGVTQTKYNPFVNSISNQTVYKNSFTYAYNFYLNKIKTKQVTGIVAFQFDRISFVAENDLLAKPALDRFRTGAFLLQYQYDDIVQAAINCTMWTGRMGHRSGILNPKFHYQCYMDTVNSVYANTSHGLLSAQVKYHLGYSQTAQLNAGIDAEQVRNAVQNHFIHDMRFIPKKYNKARNCHIPMIDDKGEQFLYREDQKVRDPKLLLNVFTNANVFY